jgi:hypothetical protein
LAERPVAHSTPRHGGVHLSLALRRALVNDATRQIFICEANSADRSAALRWPTASPAVCGGLCEEAATPGQPVPRRNAFWRNPPGNSPSRITRNRRLCRNALAGHAGHLASMSALCASSNRPSSKKPRLVVQKLWMAAIPCGNSWKIGTSLRHQPVTRPDLACSKARAFKRRGRREPTQRTQRTMANLLDLTSAWIFSAHSAAFLGDLCALCFCGHSSEHVAARLALGSLSSCALRSTSSQR